MVVYISHAHTYMVSTMRRSLLDFGRIGTKTESENNNRPGFLSYISYHTINAHMLIDIEVPYPHKSLKL